MRGTDTCVLALMAAFTSAAPAIAQTSETEAASLAEASANAQSGALGGEIVVTAQKREQKLQDVGIAITAFSGAQLRTLNVVDSRSIAAFSPGVFMGGSLGGQNSQYTIRGVTQNDFNDIVEAPNAVYLDDGYIALGVGQTMALFDIDRVEVLKGPQGTLFGRNATGGLVHFVTVKPSLDKLEGFVDLRGGFFDTKSSPRTFRGEAALNIPMSDKLAVRGSMMWSKVGDYIRNLYPAFAVGGSPGPGSGANVGGENTLGGRFSALLEPSDGTRFTLSVNAVRSNMSTPAYQEKPTIGVFDAAGELVNVIDMPANETRASIGPNGTDIGTDLDNNGVYGDSFGRPVAGADFFGYLDPDGTGVLTSCEFCYNDLNEMRSYGVNLNGEFELGDFATLTSVTDYKHFRKLFFTDAENGPGNQASNYAGARADQASQELRLSGKLDQSSWVAGLYYLYINNHSINGLKFPVGSVVPGAPFEVGSDGRLKTNSYSAFGQVDWAFAPRFTMILGGRVIREQKNMRTFQALFFNPDSLTVHQGAPLVIGPVFGANGPEAFRAKSGKTLWTGKAQLEFRPTTGLLLYAGINRGVKAGSFNSPLPGGLPIPLSAIPYKEEVLLSYEGGFKFTFPDGRTRLNASAYYYDYKDYQSFLFTGVGGIVINADARTYGLEADLFTSPIDGLDLGLSASWFDAKVKDVPLRVGGSIIRDVKPTYAPDLQGTAILRYSWDGLGGRVSVGGDANYVSSFYYNLRNFDADKFGRYVMVNASVSWTRDALKLTAGVKNLTNVSAGVQGFDLAVFSGANSVAYRPPRQFEIGARYSF